MKIISLRTLSCAAALTVMAALAPVAAAAPADAGGVTVTSHFVVTDDPATNVTGDSAYLDNGATDSQPNAIVFMALNDTPGGVCGCAILTKSLGVWYDSSKQQWAVFTEDASAMPSAPSFNILVVQKASQSVFMQNATPSNTQGNHTFINSKLLNGNPRASIQITQNFNPGGTAAGTFNPHAVGVRYYSSKKKWAIFNEDNSAIPVGAAFNVMVGQGPSNGGKDALVTVTNSDHHIGTILINNPLSNNNPNNVTFATQVFNPGGKGAIGDAHPLEVAYPNPGSGIFKETLNNSDFTTAPIGAHFNVLIFTS
jgi:hypothetical protein